MVYDGMQTALMPFTQSVVLGGLDQLIAVLSAPALICAGETAQVRNTKHSTGPVHGSSRLSERRWWTCSQQPSHRRPLPAGCVRGL